MLFGMGNRVIGITVNKQKLEDMYAELVALRAFKDSQGSEDKDQTIANLTKQLEEANQKIASLTEEKENALKDLRFAYTTAEHYLQKTIDLQIKPMVLDITIPTFYVKA
jgi:ABC-type transport system involved in cytochrome bd biosynthesis fused ATPase/permease subunit